MQSTAGSMKLTTVAATLLAIKVKAHGWSNWYHPTTPRSRQYYWSGGSFVAPYLKGAENRMDAGIQSCTTSSGEDGWMATFALAEEEICILTDDICPSIWKDTYAGFDCETDRSCTTARPNGFFGCPLNEDKELNRFQSQIASACCPGFTNMLKQTNPGGPATIYDITKGADHTKTGRKTQCWASNGGAPTANMLNQDKNLEVFDENNSKFVSPITSWTEGQDVELSWTSSANHGGSYEWAIVCGDQDETYEEFSKNRLEFIPSEVGGFYEGKLKSTEQCRRLDGTNGLKNVNHGREILSNEKNGRSYFAFIPAPSDGGSTTPANNFTMINKLRLPWGVYGQCTLGWFWWGMVSAGTFISCADIKIEKADCDGDKVIIGTTCQEPCSPESAATFSTGCIACSVEQPSRSCGKCEDGYLLRSGKCEVDCPASFGPNCSECSAPAEASRTCSACDLGFHLGDPKSAQACVSCTDTYDEHCSRCNENECTTCEPHSYPKTVGGIIDECVACTTIDEQCSTCNESGCTECQAGFRLNAKCQCEKAEYPICEETEYYQKDPNSTYGDARDYMCRICSSGLVSCQKPGTQPVCVYRNQCDLFYSKYFGWTVDKKDDIPTCATPTDETPTDETSADKTSADKTSADKTSADKTSADKTSADKTSADKTSTEDSAILDAVRAKCHPLGKYYVKVWSHFGNADDYQCMPCAGGTKLCESQNKCLRLDETCPKATPSRQTDCTDLDANCNACDASNNCSACKLNFELKAGQCVASPLPKLECTVANCDVCDATNASLCSKCKSGYVFNADKTKCVDDKTSAGQSSDKSCLDLKLSVPGSGFQLWDPDLHNGATLTVGEKLWESWPQVGTKNTKCLITHDEVTDNEVMVANFKNIKDYATINVLVDTINPDICPEKALPECYQKHKVDLSSVHGMKVTYKSTADITLQLRSSTNPHGGNHNFVVLPASKSNTKFLTETVYWDKFQPLNKDTQSRDEAVKEAYAFTFATWEDNEITVSYFGTACKSGSHLNADKTKCVAPAESHTGCALVDNCIAYDACECSKCGSGYVLGMSGNGKGMQCNPQSADQTTNPDVMCNKTADDRSSKSLSALCFQLTGVEGCSDCTTTECTACSDGKIVSADKLSCVAPRNSFGIPIKTVISEGL